MPVEATKLFPAHVSSRIAGILEPTDYSVTVKPGNGKKNKDVAISQGENPDPLFTNKTTVFRRDDAAAAAVVAKRLGRDYGIGELDSKGKAEVGHETGSRLEMYGYVRRKAVLVDTAPDGKRKVRGQMKVWALSDEKVLKQAMAALTTDTPDGKPRFAEDAEALRLEPRKPLLARRRAVKELARAGVK